MQNDPEPFFKDHVVHVYVMHAKRSHTFFKDHVACVYNACNKITHIF